MALEVAKEASDILSEEDLHRAIELEAWCDWEEEDRAAPGQLQGRVEADTGDLFLSRYRKTNVKPLWNVDENKGDSNFDSSGQQSSRSYNDIVKDLLTQLSEVEGEGYTDGIKISPAWNHTKSRVEADSGREQDGDSMLDVTKKPKYCHIAREILTSERTYVKGLSIVVKTMRSIHDGKILSEAERREIFLNIGKICALNLDLLRELEIRFLDWDPNTIVADTIVKRASFFKFYSTYAENFKTAQKVYIQKLESSKKFKKLITETESDIGNEFASFMILPIQRVPRYKLLLQDYRKYLPFGHPDTENAKDALTIISEIADDMNCKAITEDWGSQALMLKVSRCFIDGAKLLAPGRKFIGRGPVTFAPLGRKEEKILFLFSDILVVVSFAVHDQTQYQIDVQFNLRTLLVKAIEDTSVVKNAFCIALEGTKKLYRFGTRSVEERNKWTEKLKIGKVVNSDQYAVNPAFEHAAKLKDSETYKKLEHILSLLDDPSFEQTQPSWVRRSRNKNSSDSTSAKSRLPYSGDEAVDDPYDDVDHPIMKGVKETMEDITMEFEDEGEKALAIMSLKPGIDNSLSSYMIMRSPKLGNVLTRRWFVLTNQSLIICYRDHLQDEQMGAIPLAGYKVSIPTADEEEKANVLKLTHLKCPVFFFEFPCTYDFERWYSILKELLESDVNSC